MSRKSREEREKHWASVPTDRKIEIAMRRAEKKWEDSDE